MRLGPRERIFLAILLLVPLATWWFVLRPNSTRNTEMLRTIAAQQDKMRARQALNRLIDRMGAETGELAKANEVFRGRLPSENDVDNVLQQTWQLAESNQLTTRSIRTLEAPAKAPGAAASPYGEQPIAMQIEGDFAGFYKFLLAIENQPRVMRIQKMDLKRIGAGKSSQGSVLADLELWVYYDKKPPGGNPRS